MSKYTTQTDTLQQDAEINLNLFSGELHAFDTQLATIYGIEEAIVIHHFLHWVKINKRLKQNFIEGRTWTYQTQDWIIAHFPYFKNRNKLIRIIDHLVEIGVLIKGNFNKTKFDRTVWYAFKDESKFEQCIVQKRTMESAESNNPKCESEPPIPDTKDNSKTNIKENTLKSIKESPAEVLISFGRFIKMTQASYDELCIKHDKSYLDGVIDEINDYIASTGKRYKDFAATIRNWIRRAKPIPKTTEKEISPNIKTNLELARKGKLQYPEYFKDIRIFGTSHVTSDDKQAKMKGYDYLAFDMNPEEFERILFKMVGVQKS